MFTDATKAIHAAEVRGQKLMMLQLQVLLNADEVRVVGPKEFCQEVDIKPSFAREVRKMLALDRLMRQQGKRLN